MSHDLAHEGIAQHLQLLQLRPGNEPENHPFPRSVEIIRSIRSPL